MLRSNLMRFKKCVLIRFCHFRSEASGFPEFFLGVPQCAHFCSGSVWCKFEIPGVVHENICIEVHSGFQINLSHHSYLHFFCMLSVFFWHIMICFIIFSFFSCHNVYGCCFVFSFCCPSGLIFFLFVIFSWIVGRCKFFISHVIVKCLYVCSIHFTHLKSKVNKKI